MAHQYAWSFRSRDWQCFSVQNMACEKCRSSRRLASYGVCKTWPVKNAAHRGDLPLMEDLRRQNHMFGTSDSLPMIDVFLEDGDRVTFGDDVSLQVLHIPGHSPGSIALYSPEQNWIISGDVLFRGSVGRTDIPFSDYDVLIDSIKKKMLTLPPETVVYPGHGIKTTIGEEKERNPFLI